MLRVLAYGISSGAFDENVRLSESTIRASVKRSAAAVVHLHSDQCLRCPTQSDLNFLCAQNAQRGFPGMWGV